VWIRECHLCATLVQLHASNPGVALTLAAVLLPLCVARGKVILTAAKQVAKWTLPSFICRDNLGE
jgi:hypothetical protein